MAVLILVLPLSAFAQKSPVADSLIASLSQIKSDTARINRYFDIADAYANTNSDEGLKWARKALGEAKRAEWKNGIPFAMLYIGNSYRSLAQYDSARKYYKAALISTEKTGDKIGMANSLNALGMNYQSQSNYAEALRNLYKALAIFEELDKKDGIAMCYGNLGVIYDNLKDWGKARDYYKLAISEYQTIGDKQSFALNLTNLGNLYQEMTESKTALVYQKQALAAAEANGFENLVMINLSNIGTSYSNIYQYAEAVINQKRSLELARNFGDAYNIGLNLGNLGKTYLQAGKDTIRDIQSMLQLSRQQVLKTAGDYLSEAISMLEQTGNLDDVAVFYAARAELKEYEGNGIGALKDLRESIKLRDTIFSAEARTKMANLEAERDQQVKEKQAELDRGTAIRKRNERIYFTAGLCLLLTVVFFVTRERKRSEKLLLNILPFRIAKRLKQHEHPIADYFDEVSILFIDMANFTPYTHSQHPKVMVSTLNDIFTRFDALAEMHGLEKIKTIGDCYMAVAGLPQVQKDHAQRAAAMAVGVKESIKDYVMPDGQVVAFRIGIDCGPVVAGVIGQKKFSYDLWGHAVNTASRMEMMGIPGEVHCTDNFRKAVGPGYQFTSRGKMNIKGIGDMETWLMN